MTERPVRVLGEGRFLRLVDRGGWELVERIGDPAIVAIVAVTPAGELLLVEQWREPVAARVVELPAGLVGDDAGHEGEALEAAAARELEEETGWQADSFERLTVGPPSAGQSSEVVTLMRAHGLRRAGDGGGVDGEEIEVHAVPVAEVPAFLEGKAAAGRLLDHKVWAGLWFAGRD